MNKDYLSFIVTNENNEPVLNDLGQAILKPEPSTKSIDDVERVISLNKPTEVIRDFAGLVSLAEQWNWAKSYRDYLIVFSEVSEYNANLPETFTNEDGELIEVNLKPLPLEPERPEIKTIDEVLEPYARTIFKSNRQKLLDTLTVEVDGMVFDGDEASQSRMGRASFSMEPGEKIGWVLANNDEVTVTKDQLAKALRLAGAKQAAIWTPKK